MKKLMTLMLGLSLVFGSAAFASPDDKAGEKKADAGKESKKKGKKKADKPADAK